LASANGPVSVSCHRIAGWRVCELDRRLEKNYSTDGEGAEIHAIAHTPPTSPANDIFRDFNI